MKEKLRKLFTQHVFYTKLYMESSMADLSDVKVISERLLRNQDDIGNFIKSIVGVVNGNNLSMLLREHILAASEVINAVKNNDEKRIKVAVTKAISTLRDRFFTTSATGSTTKNDPE
jgi:hypothetical protein